MNKGKIDPYILLKMYSISRTDLVPSHIVLPCVFVLICHAIKNIWKKEKSSYES